MSQTPSKLERHARALLRAYPAEYRHGRAEEIVGTLLEAAPPGRSWPTAREAWSLAAGGRHARAARNRRPGVKVHLRLALLLGISIYISFMVAAGAFGMGLLPGPGGTSLGRMTGALTLAAALSPWLASRAVVTALVIPAGALAAYRASVGHIAWPDAAVGEFLILLAALAVSSGGPVRLPRSWLLLPCAFPLALVVELLSLPSRYLFTSGREMSLLLDALLLLAVAVVCWLVTDARPAFALCLTELLYAVTTTLPQFVSGYSPVIDGVKYFLLLVAIALPLLLPASWLLLRRQKAPSPFSES